MGREEFILDPGVLCFVIVVLLCCASVVLLLCYCCAVCVICCLLITILLGRRELDFRKLCLVLGRLHIATLLFYQSKYVTLIVRKPNNDLVGEIRCRGNFASLLSLHQTLQSIGLTLHPGLNQYAHVALNTRKSCHHL